jgi:hypothetical protein
VIRFTSGHYLPHGESARIAAQRAFERVNIDITGKYIEKHWNGSKMGTYGDQAMTDDDLAALFDQAEAECTRSPFTNDHEAAFVRLLEHIRANPEALPEAEARFVDAIATNSLCYELVAFCMHTLRLPSVAEAARQRLSPSDPRGWGPLSTILSSFEDDWSDASMYEYYSSKEAPAP